MLTQSVQISESKRKRRKRTDDEGRNHMCKCGKSYLSYPALYTHIKTKHSDEPVSKLAKSYDNLDSPLLGLQKFQKQSSKQKQNLTPVAKQKQLEDNYPLYGNSLPEVNNIEVLKEFLFKYFPNIAVNHNQSYKVQLLVSEKKQLKEMKEYWTNNNRKKQDENFTQVYETPINFVLGKFILQIQADVQSSSFKKFISLFIFAIKKALDKIKDQAYFKQHNASQLPMLFDDILKDHLLLDSNDHLSNPTIASKTLYYLGRWLYVNKFTNLSLKYNF